MAKALSDKSLDNTALRGELDVLLGDNHSQAGMSTVIKTGNNQYLRAGDSDFSVGKHPGEVFGRQQAHPLSKAEIIHGDAILASAGLAQAERRLRPFARRRLIKCRPLLVAMRERKPWVRLRLSTLGWNVLFMMAPQQYLPG